MRHSASELLDARNVALEFRAPDTNQDREVRTDKRRQIFLIFKEGLNNAVRHAECQRVTIEIVTDKHHIQLTLGDDGKGFDTTRINGNNGHGLRSMADRAKSLNAEFNVDSHPGGGTTLVLRVPL